MRDDAPRPEKDGGKSPHERFKELGARIMAVPKSEADEQEKKWQRERKQQKA